ncbi:MAG TPA: hypothetical protein VGR35_08500 [Tepidisphaeraceae bacterium]|nr:hypothetical protein [Tepidisphaeraceae bacterium]
MRPKLLVSIVVCSTALLMVAADARKPAVVMAPLTVLTGNDSHVKKPTYERITSAADWKKTWLNHLGMKEDTIYRPAMEVDFSRCEVIAVFEGESWNSCGFRIDSVTEQDDSIVVRFDDISYQTAGPDGGGDRVTPFAFVVLPKSQKLITLEDNVQQYIGHPPEWKEVARRAHKKG